MSECVTLYVTKYALTSGIREVLCHLDENDRTRVTDVTNRFMRYYGEGKDWHRTRAEAIARAEMMRAAKITSLKEQIATLENLSFNSSRSNGHVKLRGRFVEGGESSAP
jgi:hypothetical protein